MTDEDYLGYKKRRSDGFYDTKLKWRKSVNAFIKLATPVKKEVKNVRKDKKNA